MKSWLMIIMILIVITINILFLWQTTDRPYERPRRQTQEETEQVKRALKRHGQITPITTNTRIYFVRDAQEITILWRG